MVEKLAKVSDEVYGVSIILTDHFYNMLSPVAKARCRKIDNIQMDPLAQPFEIFTFDAKDDCMHLDIEGHAFGDVINQQLAQNNQQEVELFINQNESRAEVVWEVD